jgi:hypothetical protein
VDVRWIAYVGSGLIAAVSLVPVSLFHEPAPAAPEPAARDAVARPDPILVDVERQAQRLREYASIAPQPRRPARDPFRYAPRHAELPPAFRPGPPPAPAAALPPESAPAAAPRLTLIGMAERETPDGVVRVAILSGFGDVHLAGAGDRIAGRFTVLAVSADAVELQDEATQSILRLGLR